jgi:hypothetical protein
MFERVTVWLDDLAPAGGGFGQALEWAARFHLPLQGIFLQASGGDSKLLDPCADHCRQRSVAWTAVFWEGQPVLSAIDFIRSGELCVFSNALAPRLWDALLHWTLSSPETIALVCPKESAQLGRPLIVNEDNDPASTFLASAARLCKTLALAPVVLTVARYEGEAIRRERAAEKLFRLHGVQAEFDSIACADIRRAVALVARCRGCTHVFVERRHAASWWRWLRRETLQRLLGLADPLTFLTYSAKWRPLEADEPSAARAKVDRAGQDLASTSRYHLGNLL